MRRKEKPFWLSIVCKGEFKEIVKIDDFGYLPAHYRATEYAWKKYPEYELTDVLIYRFFEPVETKETLKSCPECGTEALLVKKHVKSPNPWRMHYFVCCCGCKYRKNNEYNKPEKAITDWNS